MERIVRGREKRNHPEVWTFPRFSPHPKSAFDLSLPFHPELFPDEKYKKRCVRREKGREREINEEKIREIETK